MNFFQVTFPRCRSILLHRKAILFKYVDDKDVFQKFYTRFLARRLVNFATVSEECESSMITKLKGTCGAEYTNKLQRMLTDIRLSDEMNVKYKKSRDIKGPCKGFSIANSTDSPQKFFSGIPCPCLNIGLMAVLL